MQFLKDAAKGTAHHGRRLAGRGYFHCADLFENLMRDLKSIRALWNIIFMCLFVWVCIWLVLYYAETCGNTVVVVLGGVVGTVFTNYVWVTHKERMNGHKNGAQPHVTPAPLPEGSRPDSQD